MKTIVLDLFKATHYSFNPYALPTLFVAIANIVLGGLVLLRARRSWPALSFFITTLSIGIWLFAFSAMYCSVAEEVALVWARIAYIGVASIPTAIYQFTIDVLPSRHKERRLLTTGWCLSGLFAVVILSSNALIADLYSYWWGFYPKYGWLGVPFLGFFFVMLAASLQHYGSRYRAAGSLGQKRRVKYLMAAFSVAYLGSVDYFAKYGIPLYPFGYAPILVFLILMTRFILRYRIINLTPEFAAQKILDTMKGAVLVVDTEGIISIANRSAQSLLGYTEPDLEGLPLTTVVTSSDPAGLLTEEAYVDHITQWKAKQGYLIDVSVSASPIVDRSGQKDGTVYVATDISERMRTERTLLENQKELARSKAEREQLELFASVASHDLKEPLRKIVTFGDLLAEESGPALDERARNYLNRMRETAQRMNQLIDDLLEYSKSTANQETLGSVDLKRVVEDVLTDLELKISTTHAEISVGNLPVVYGNRVQMRQLFQNLINNALKFHKKEEPPRISIFSEVRKNGDVLIFVEDKGIGFDEKYAQRIFRPFERLHSRTEYEGSGIGLAICQKIAAHHGGTITAKSAPGQGSQFIIALPKARSYESVTVQ